MDQRQADIVIVGAGLGGCAAALAAAEAGRTVLLVGDTDWIGGQLTTQLVPPDEHGWIERFGCTASYRRLRRLISEQYRARFPLRPEVRAVPALNPGNAWVSPLAHEPAVALSALREMLGPHLALGRLHLLLEYVPVAVAKAGADTLSGVVVKNLTTGASSFLQGAFIIDATELGDLLELGEIEHITGQESQTQTREPSAPVTARPDSVQAFTWCFALEHHAGKNFVTSPPEGYEHWSRYVFPLTPPWPGRVLSFEGMNPRTMQRVQYRFDPAPAPQPHGHIERTLWTYRRIRDRSLFVADAYASDVSVINWPQNDYLEKSLLHGSSEERAAARAGARQQSLSLLHWLRTEGPRPDGGRGWPGLRLCPEATGTADGLAKCPYIRESRRIRAEFTICEQMVSPAFFPATATHGAEFEDSVGIGSYRIDLHPSTGGNNFIDVPTLPFQIPLGALIPVRVENLLPAAKNIGTTHITNGCYRLHPVEWNIGEAAGALAAFCLKHNLRPRAVRRERQWLERYQCLLVQRGVELAWPKDLVLEEGDPHAHAPAR